MMMKASQFKTHRWVTRHRRQSCKVSQPTASTDGSDAKKRQKCSIPTADRAHLRPRQDEMTHLWEANASRRNHTELSLLNIKMMMVMLIDDTILKTMLMSNMTDQ